MNRSAAFPIAITILACGQVAHAAPRSAQSPATWVAGTGTDTGLCPVTAPCRTFQYAHDRTNAGGVINVLSAGSFGPVKITKSISIVANGVEALIESHVSCSSFNVAVCISGGTAVRLRGLTIDVNDSSISTGILFLSGRSLFVENCVIRRADHGIDFRPLIGSGLFVSDCAIAENRTDGISFTPVGNGTFNLTLDRVSLTKNGLHGLSVNTSVDSPNAKATVRESVADGNSGSGIRLAAIGGTIKAMIDHTTLVNNAIGLEVENAGATARIADSTVTGNGTGLKSGGSGHVVSFGTNKVSGNTTDGSPTGTVGYK
jgi:hypothetical protein